LTQNAMVLKKVFINGKVYGNNQDDEPNKLFTINGDIGINKKLISEDKEDFVDKKMISDFLYLLSLCHAVFIEINQKTGKINYQGASPDDIALVKGAQQIGVEFSHKDLKALTVHNHITKLSKEFEIKAEMPFDSDRKRMSVVVRDIETGDYLVLSKGADTTMLNRMEFQNKELEEAIRVIKVLSKEGLRVLCLGHKRIRSHEYERWYKKFDEVNRAGEDLSSLYEELECSLEFLGCTAIEDKLQEGVGETIYTLLTCNIRVWVLTGDKQDTAEEIAKSCKLINDNMFILYLVDDGDRTAAEKLQEIINVYNINIEMNVEIDLDDIFKKIRKKEGKDMSIIVDGITLSSILDNEELSLQFFYIAIAAKSVICCRVSPKQKSRVVQLAKKYGKWITLSIGDGANDVPMIMEAHIGVGIQGKEGTQAVRSADFSIGQFRFLEKLLLNYGRIGYIKVSKFICYYFYKNIILVITDLFFAFSNGFSGQIFFADYLSTMYNAFFTSWPCLFTFSFEKDVDIQIVKKFPIIYMAGQKNFFFNMRVFWGYIIYAIFHGYICYYVPVFGMKYFNDNSGVTFDHWYKSTTSFSMIIHIVTIKLLVISDFWNVVNIGATIGSILFYYLVILIMNTDTLAFILQNELAGLFFNIIGYMKFWIVIIIVPIAALMPDIAIKQFFYTFRPNPTDYIKHHLKDPALKAMVFSDEKQFQVFNSKEAKKAEKLIQEILHRARLNKKIEQSEFSMHASSDLLQSQLSSFKAHSNTNLPNSEIDSHSDRKVLRISESNVNMKSIQEVDEEKQTHMKKLIKTNTFAKKASVDKKEKYGYIHTPISSSEDEQSQDYSSNNLVTYEPAELLKPTKLESPEKETPKMGVKFNFQSFNQIGVEKQTSMSSEIAFKNKNISSFKQPHVSLTPNEVVNADIEKKLSANLYFDENDLLERRPIISKLSSDWQKVNSKPINDTKNDFSENFMNTSGNAKIQDISIDGEVEKERKITNISKIKVVSKDYNDKIDEIEEYFNLVNIIEDKK
jgi:magnesium-transporting ATPase (P-type)